MAAGRASESSELSEDISMTDVLITFALAACVHEGEVDHAWLSTKVRFRDFCGDWYRSESDICDGLHFRLVFVGLIVSSRPWVSLDENTLSSLLNKIRNGDCSSSSDNER